MKVLIVDEMHPSLPPMLKDLGLEPDYRPDIGAHEIGDVLSDESYIGLIVRSKTKVDAKLLAKAHSLRFVARAGAGTDGVDKNYLKKRGIKLVHAAEGNRDAVAEHTVGLILALLNKFVQGHNQISKFEFNRKANRGTELMGKTVGLIGYGYMGQAVARRLSGFSVRTIYYDIKNIRSGRKFAKPAALNTLLEQADVISFHIPLTNQNRSWINKDFFDKCKKQPYIINTSRGEIMVMKDLLHAINEGRIAGAALDVFENENFNSLTQDQKSTLKSLINTGKVIFTPHVAGWTYESYLKINQVLTEKIKKLIWSG